MRRELEVILAPEEAGVLRPIHSPAANQSCRQSWLSTQLAAPVTIVWTNNRTVMFSLKGHALNGYHLRLHRMFLQAPNTVWHALVAYVRNTPGTAREILRTYIQRQQHLIHSPPRRLQRLPTLKPRGHYFDLETIYGELNRTYFANRIQASITWSRRPLKRPRTSIRFGSYHVRDRVIRIHRLLDQAFVPQYVVENVVFHEMLHALIPSRRVNGRWCIHPPEFRQHERRFQYHWEAEQWKRCHLPRLLRG